MTDADDPAASRWLTAPDVARGADYQARFDALAAEGHDVHGEAALVAALAPAGGRALDAGCGTGRVAIELARRGFDTVGVDIDPAMLAEARRLAPSLTWHEADLAAPSLAALVGAPVDVAVAAGNVLIFVAPGTEAQAVAQLASTLRPGGVLVTGFSVRRGGYDPAALDAHAAAAGLTLIERWSTWDRQRWAPSDRYQVAVHRR